MAPGPTHQPEAGSALRSQFMLKGTNRYISLPRKFIEGGAQCHWHLSRSQQELSQVTQHSPNAARDLPSRIA